MRDKQYIAHCYWFLGGLLVGAVAALLMAPQSGRRTRRTLQRKAEDAAESVEDAAQELRDRGKHIAKGATDLVDRATRALSR